MHELSYVVSFVNDAIDEAILKQATSVVSIHVSVGEMTDVVPDYLYKYYPDAVKGTLLEGSELKVSMVPVMVECGKCRKLYHPTKEGKYLCPHCGDGSGRVVSGRDVVLESIEVCE